MITRQIIGNTTELLKDFDSRSLKIIDKLQNGDKFCTIYDNGRVVYDNLSANTTYVIHIDVSDASSFGFVRNDESFKVYKCCGGLITIYDIETKDRKEYILPNRNFHVEPNTVSIKNSIVYTIVGISAIANDPSLYNDIRNNEYSSFVNNGETYIIRETCLYNTSFVDGDITNNQIKMLVKNVYFGKYEISDYTVSDDNRISVITKSLSGTILSVDKNGSISSIFTGYKYNPQVLLSNIIESTGSVLLPKIINNYENLKFRDLSSIYDKKFLHENNRIKFAYDEDDNIVIIDHNMSIDNMSISTTDDMFNTINSVKGITPVTRYISSDARIFPPNQSVSNDKLSQVSSDGKSVVIANGHFGAFVIRDGIVSTIANCIGFPAGYEVNSGIFGDDGFLYLSLVNKGYILRNTYKGDFTHFTDIVTSSYSCEDANLDTNTLVSNIIPVKNGIWFTICGSHNLTMPNRTISNSGTYHFNSETAMLTKVETIPNISIAFDKIVFMSYADNLIFVHVIGNTNTVRYYDPISLTKLGEFNTAYKLVKIVGYKGYFVGVDKNGTIVSFSIFESVFTLLKVFNVYSYSNPNDNIKYNLSQVVNKKPYISDMISNGDKTIIAMFTSEDTIKIGIQSIDGYNYTQNICVPVTITKNTKLRLSNNGSKVNLEVLDHKHIGIFCSWDFDISKDIPVFTYNALPSYVGNNEFKVISKSTSISDVIINEGSITGDNCSSDFGAFQCKLFGNQYKKSTINHICQDDSNGGNSEMYYNRRTLEESRVVNNINLKPGYTFVLSCGYGKCDCKVYIAKDSNGNLRFINEYVTNNKDIVDIGLDNVSNIGLLGSPWPGSTVFNNVNYWIVGEFNNCAVGFVFRTGTKVISKIVYLGVKSQFVIDVDIETLYYPNNGNCILAFDDVHGECKLVNTDNYNYFLKINSEGFRLIDVFERELSFKPVSYFFNPNPNNEPNMFNIVTTIYDKDYKVDFSKYFVTKTNFRDNDYDGKLKQRSIIDLFDYIDNRQLLNLYKQGSPVYSVEDDNYIINTTSQYLNPIMLATFTPSKFGDVVVSSDNVRIFVNIDKEAFDCKINPSIMDIFTNGFYIGESFDSTVKINLTKVNGSDHIYSGIVQLNSNVNSLTIFVNHTIFNTSVNVKFKLYSSAIFHGTVARTPINPSSICIDSNQYARLSDEYGCSKNDKVVGPSIGLIPTDVNCRNVLIFPPVTKRGLYMKLSPSYPMWLAYDNFSFFKFGNLEIVGQLVDIVESGGSNIIVFGYYINGILQGYSSEYTIVNHLTDINLSFGLYYISETVSECTFHYNGEIIFENINIDTNDNYDKIEILNRYYGDISNMSYVDGSNVPLYDQSFVHIGNNAFGEVTSYVRDYKSGRMKAIVSPSSTGIWRDKGLLCFMINETSIDLVETIPNVQNDLFVREVGYSENSAFKLITVVKPVKKDLTGYEPITYNIFKRTVKEYVPTYSFDILSSVSGEVIEKVSDGVEIETTEFKI